MRPCKRLFRFMEIESKDLDFDQLSPQKRNFGVHSGGRCPDSKSPQRKKGASEVDNSARFGVNRHPAAWRAGYR